MRAFIGDMRNRRLGCCPAAQQALTDQHPCDRRAGNQDTMDWASAESGSGDRLSPTRY